MDNLNIVFFTNNTLSMFAEHFKKSDLRITYEHQFDSFIRNMPPYDNRLTIVDAVNLAEGDVSRAVSFLVAGNHKFIVVCDNVSAGFDFLSKGALDMFVINKNESESDNFAKLHLKIKQSKETHSKHLTRILKYSGSAASDKIILIGSSTGGSQTVHYILKELPENICPIAIVVHMPPVFTKMYAKQMDDTCKISVWEAKDGDMLKPGLALVAPGDFQLKIQRSAGGFGVRCEKSERVNGHAPSVDVMFNTAAEVLGGKAIGVILTGMGADGAAGLLKMRERGAFTLGQDQESSIVYGMPKVAFEMGAVMKQASYKDIARLILENL